MGSILRVLYKIRKTMITFSGAVIFLAYHSVYGQSRGPYDYVESAAVFNQYLPDPEYEIDSPAFRKSTLQFTTQIEFLAFIYNLEQSTSTLKTEVLGTSQDGQAIMLLKFTRNNSQLPKPKILIVGQQHGRRTGRWRSGACVCRRID